MNTLIELLRCWSAHGPSKPHVRRTCERVLANSLRRQPRDRKIDIRNMDVSKMRESQMNLRHCFETCLGRARCLGRHETCIPSPEEIGSAFSTNPYFRPWEDGYETAILTPEYQTWLSKQSAKLGADDKHGSKCGLQGGETVYCASVTGQFLKYSGGNSTSG